ncbi:Discoidin domain receptor [Aphelenchoides fujianensis]|nr:Discoidin domain receptor [Aphelenchoides fujianensis]
MKPPTSSAFFCLLLSSLVAGFPFEAVRTETGSGAWCPKHQINASSQEWLQVELPADSLITAIETQGRDNAGRGVEFAKTLMLEYWRESLGRWARYRDAAGNEILAANSDPRTPVLNRLDGGFVAKLVRIIPVSEQTRTVCIRLELFGCPYRQPVRSYAMPQGSSIGDLDIAGRLLRRRRGGRPTARRNRPPAGRSGGRRRLHFRPDRLDRLESSGSREEEPL